MKIDYTYLRSGFGLTKRWTIFAIVVCAASDLFLAASPISRFRKSSRRFMRIRLAPGAVVTGAGLPTSARR